MQWNVLVEQATAATDLSTIWSLVGNDIEATDCVLVASESLWDFGQKGGYVREGQQMKINKLRHIGHTYTRA